MRCKIVTITMVVILILTEGCSYSLLEEVTDGYDYNVNQGNYFTSNDVSKVCIGMTKQQVVYILGTPMMSDPFGTNTWFYVFRRKLGRKNIIQQTLTLTFDNNGVLTNIDNKFV